MSWPALLALGGGLSAIALAAGSGAGKAGSGIKVPDHLKKKFQDTGSPPGPKPPSGGKTVLPFSLSSLEADVIRATKAGRLQFRWTTLPAAPDVEVTTDAVMIDGVRFPVTARVAQWVCDLLGDGIRMTTPMVEDLIEEGAVTRIKSPTYDHTRMHTAEAVKAFNDGCDAQLRDHDPRRLVGMVGKSWVLVRGLEVVPGAPSPSKWAKRRADGLLVTDGMATAVNYGMIPGPYRSVTGKYKLWQQPGYRHNVAHWDYSQVLRLCRPRYDGVEVPGDTTLTRQPGVGKVGA